MGKNKGKVESECEQYCCPAHFQVSWGLAQIARDCQHVPADTALPRVDNYHFAIFGLDPDLCLNALGLGPLIEQSDDINF